MAVQKQDDQHEHTFSSYVRIRDVVLKTYLGRWTIGRRGERGSGISVLPARHDDDDIYYQNGFWRNHSTSSQILTICQIMEGIWAKNLEVIQLFVDFSKACDSIYKGKIKQMLLAFDLAKETVIVIMMLYESNESLIWWRQFLQLCYWSLARRYISIIFVTLYFDYVLWKFNKNGFSLKKEADDIPQKLWQIQICWQPSASHKYTCPSKISTV